MADRIIGCRHKEGIDYEGSTCPTCPFWPAATAGLASIYMSTIGESEELQSDVIELADRPLSAHF